MPPPSALDTPSLYRAVCPVSKCESVTDRDGIVHFPGYTDEATWAAGGGTGGVGSSSSLENPVERQHQDDVPRMIR